MRVTWEQVVEAYDETDKAYAETEKAWDAIQDYACQHFILWSLWGGMKEVRRHHAAIATHQAAINKWRTIMQMWRAQT